MKSAFDFELRNVGGVIGKGKGEGWDLFLPGITAFFLCSLSFCGPKYLNLVWKRLRCS